MKRYLLPGLLLAGLALGAWWLTGAGSASPAPAVETVPVVAGKVDRRDMAIWIAGVGSVAPLNVVTVKVRVDGQLDRVDFTEGQMVKKGDLLAEIDPRPFQAQLKQAEAALMKDRAQLANARIDLERYVKLSGMGAAPTRNVDELKAQIATLEAQAQADQAAIDTARLNLGFTRITAPLTGRTGLRLVHAGSIVHPSDAGGLVTVTQIEPITVLFSLPQDSLGDVMAAAQGKVIAATRDGGRPLAEGELDFIDSQVDPMTGQIRLRGRFANTDHALWPGAFVAARLLLRTDRQAVAVPSQAVLQGETGPYLYVIKPDRTVEARRVKTGASADGFTALLSGAEPGETIVVEGQSRLSPGAKVAPAA